uniref:Platelet glycoprotein 4 n=1 Tax=Neogobius melanostomus TaxID=47308 RepID=A0A8C6WMP2_9GOBI
MGCCNARCGLITGAVFGAVLAILGGVLIPLGNLVIEGTVKKEAVIENGTTFWFLTVNNPQAVIKDGATPVVIERGPFTYKTRFLPKHNITFNPNHTASFLLPTIATFEPNMSVGTEDEEVVVLNLAVAVSVINSLHILLEGMIKSSNSSLFQKRSVKELLWGYTDPLLKDTLSLFENGTYDGPYNVFTGKDDIAKVATIESYKGERELPYWNDTFCNMINGTDASSFAPFVDKKKPLYFFSSDICRSVSASYMRSYPLKGITVYRYSLLHSTLASPVDNPENHCYCRDREVTKNCTLAGVLDISTCQMGKPIYISLPHFLFASPLLREQVQGLSPNEEHHETFLDVEPTTGFTLNFAKRIQINMMYGPSKVITVLKKVKNYTIFPIVWMNETASLDDATADMLKEELVSRIQLLATVQQALLGAGVAIFIVCLISYCCVRRNTNQGKQA